MNSMVISHAEMRELDDQEVLEINGGIGFVAAAAAIGAGMALFSGSYAAGESVGKFIYNVLN